VPTVRPRHLLTETDDVAAAIDAAAARYPGASRADVLRRLVELGAAVVEHDREERRRLVASRAGRHRSTWTADERRALAEEWPE